MKIVLMKQKNVLNYNNIKKNILDTFYLVIVISKYKKIVEEFNVHVHI